jgi:glucose/arabinose dehydrogenase
MMSKCQWLGQRGSAGMILAILWVCLSGVGGCTTGPRFIPSEARTPIDRKVMEYPRAFLLQLAADGLTAPSAIAFVTEDGEYKGSILVAESGADGRAPRIFGWKSDHTYFSIYPHGRQIPTFGLLPHQKDIYGPIGGMAVSQGRIYVTHRDSQGRGVVSAFKFDGSRETIVGDLPAEGDYGVTDIAVNPINSRVYFGVGAATNSGIVGLDNWSWVQKHPNFCDQPAQNLRLLGFKYLTKNPLAGLFGGDDNVETGPFQPFGKNKALRIPAASNGKPTAAIFSASPGGGDVQLEAWGIRYPRGLAFLTPENRGWTQLYATNEGMELRGSRPVKDDPDALYRIDRGGFYGWPDYSANLKPISDEFFLPPPEIMSRNSYPEALSFLIDHAGQPASPGRPAVPPVPDPTVYRAAALVGEFSPLSGAAKLDFVPTNIGFGAFEGRAIVALAGDRAPFATSGIKLKDYIGYKVVIADLTNKPEDFIRNTEGVPASKLGRGVVALERPIDVKFGPDGKLYILDYGQMEMRGSREKITPGTGRIFVLEPAPASAR